MNVHIQTQGFSLTPAISARVRDRLFVHDADAVSIVPVLLSWFGLGAVGSAMQAPYCSYPDICLIFTSFSCSSWFLRGNIVTMTEQKRNALAKNNSARNTETANHVTKPNKEIDDHSPIRSYLVPPPSNGLLTLTTTTATITTTSFLEFVEWLVK